MKSFFLIIAILLAFPGCDQRPDSIIDPSGRQPNLVAVVLTTPAFNTDTILVGGQRNPSDQLILAIRFQATIGIPATSIRAFHYNVTSTPSGNEITSGDIVLSDLERWQFEEITNPVTLAKNFPLPIQRVDVGTFAVEISAIDVSGLESNVFIAPLKIARLNRPPQISSLSAPDTLQLPSQGLVVMMLSLRVDDPDGVADISTVRFTSILPDGKPSSAGPIEMFDDGSYVDLGGYSSGDAVDADGIYSRIIQLLSTAATGMYTFSFVAIDRSNDSSNVITHTILVQ
jgi:hypothetical protein